MTAMIQALRQRAAVGLVGTLILWASSWSYAEQVFQLRNGMVIRGSKAEIATLKEGFGAAAAGQANVRPIWVIDDGLRRNFLHGKGMVAAPPIDDPDLTQPIEFWQPRPVNGKIVGGLGSILGVSPFNEFGRRQFRMSGPKGPVQVIQGLAELNPSYARLVSLRAPKGQPNLSWDMRVATSSLSSETLLKIFKTRTDWDDIDRRFDVLRLFIAAGRFIDAINVLEQMIIDFPDEPSLKKQLIGLNERQAIQLLEEVEVRIKAGQYQLAKLMLDSFPVAELSRLTRVKVSDVRASLDQSDQQVRASIEQLAGQVKQLPAGQQQSLGPIIDEISNGLSADTISRLSDYSRLGNAATIELENRIALAVAGWLLGSGSGEQNLTIAIALIRVRDLVQEFLGSDDAARRQAILDELRNLEGAQPEYVDRMLRLLLPTRPWPEDSADPTVDGLFRVETDKAAYVVQLPPEYNPRREYPCVIALHTAGGTPEDQINWWAGVYDPTSQTRLGHAARNGFIVVAPVWGRPNQRAYEYTPAEHEFVLSSMRDAMRRCSIDADRVFLAGHGEGATAAWDIALAHPDLWAGMIAISGSPSKTILHFEPNSQYVPLYLVMGKLDGSAASGSILDNYMSFQHDALVVEYRGRGREFFYEELPRIFEWMSTSAHLRREIPQEFSVVTMRTGDQFFWWLELGQLKPGVGVDPILWDQASRIRSAPVEGTIGTGNQIRVRGPSDEFRILLRPQKGIDLNEEVLIRNGSRLLRFDFDGRLDTMLEDVRRRADRKRPFWMDIRIP